jgi:DNA-binding MarR family transcriptional regulator
MYQYPDGEDGRSLRILELSRHELKTIARLLSQILDAPQLNSPTQHEDAQRPSPSQSPTDDQLIGHAKWLFHIRKTRERFFHPGLFGEAAWDVLLALFIMDQAGPALTIAALSNVAHVPTATMIRWLHTLEDQGLVMRQPHPHDRRSTIIKITPSGRQRMESYLSETLTPSA